MPMTTAALAELRYRWYCVRLWIRERPERMAWWLAFHLPRRVALFAFVRVSAAGGRSPDDCTYEHCYDDWTKGAGR